MKSTNPDVIVVSAGLAEVLVAAHELVKAGRRVPGFSKAGEPHHRQALSVMYTPAEQCDLEESG
jgi:predicted oxidoreductase